MGMGASLLLRQDKMFKSLILMNFIVLHISRVLTFFEGPHLFQRDMLMTGVVQFYFLFGSRVEARRGPGFHVEKSDLESQEL